MRQTEIFKDWHRILGGRRFWVVSAFVVPALLVGILFFRSRDKAFASEKSAETKTGEQLTVHLIRPKLEKIVKVVGQPSFVVPYERSSVYPKMTAYIDQWNVDIGDKVKKGQVLARLFVPELVEDLGTKRATVKLDAERVEFAKKVVKVAEADVKAAEARLVETKEILDKYVAEVVRWESEVKRLTREVKGGVVDPQVLLESENQLRSNIAAREAAKAAILKADAELLSRRATVDQDIIAVDVAAADLKVADSEAKRLEALVGYLDLPAPFDGIITVRNANTYDFVLPATGDPTAMQRSPHLAPGGSAAPIYVVDRTDIVRIYVDIPEHDANYVNKGTRASVQIRGFRDQWIPATVTRTSWALNIKSRTLRAEIDLENIDSKILPGMYAYGKVIIERKGVWTVPVSSLVNLGEKTYFWNYDKGIATRVEIQTGAEGKGPKGNDLIEVTSRKLPHPEFGTDGWVPIDGSEQVIATDDLGLLTDGDKVHVLAGSGNQPAPK